VPASSAVAPKNLSQYLPDGGGPAIPVSVDV